MEKYAEVKRLPEDFLRALGIVERKYLGMAALLMPYFDLEGNEAARR